MGTAALLEYRMNAGDGRQMGNYIVVSMSDGYITNMQEYRGHSRAKRAAQVT